MRSVVGNAADSRRPSPDDVAVAGVPTVERVGVPSDERVTDVFARDCLSRKTLEDLAGKWGILALLALGENDHRFNALRRRVDGVSEKMLSQTLQLLERDGMVLREVHTTIPPRVAYSLTALGQEVAERLRALADLLEESVSQVSAARGRYDLARASRTDVDPELGRGASSVGGIGPRPR